ncbi:hypothetical protein ACIRVK_13720 [Streptomyces sp. NPDC101152]|uniref:hypothetical protein n=1 Tax=Streptomyces sp. NPDC101152 TaxID=3366116 RepID=UPI00382BBBED
MKIATDSIISLAPTGPDWVVAFDLGGETGEVVCPVIGWATVVQAHMQDGSVVTEIKPAFLWGDLVWIENELRDHTPDLGYVEVRAREITRV